MGISEIFSATSLVVSISAVIITYYYNKRQTSIFQKQLEEMMKKPELEVKFDFSVIDRSVSFASFRAIPVQETPKVAKIVRVKVFNKGKATAEECMAKAEIFRNNEWETFGGVRLHWIRYWEGLYNNMNNMGDLYKPVNIAVNDYEIADLVFIIKDDSKYITAIRCDRGYDLAFVDARVHLKKGDIIKVTVYCENATSNPVCLRVRKVPTYDSINSNNVKEFFEEVKCPKLT
ncbi:hypothetical protein STK_13340 [Sulfurisphaera tokodaii str. 7]|uniref:Uncharacterized protein n=1 Tax=Sulfurisphaera tokodaii (strain DSM 16993 / JCM 10545 / NBRC 100140 / 7) TaxID=273063 RepID=Q971M7_SULTO|nr:hypothetical protein [Sulfurisphaera tokodaii]BAB66393.1 hypothetical protein STK_13340 [Sulfurisphaera tokodaii str. 7]